MGRKPKRTKVPKNLKPVVVWIQRKSDIQHGYLSRLIRLLRMSRDQPEDLNDERIWLVNRSIFACVLECIENGAKGEAYEALRRYRVNFRFSARKKRRPQQTTLPR